MTPRWKIYMAMAIVYLVWGSTFLAIRIAVATIPPFLLAGTRFLCGGLILYLLGFWQNQPKPTLGLWKSSAIIGFLLSVTGNGIVVWAEQWIPSGLSALLISTVPLWMVCSAPY